MSYDKLCFLYITFSIYSHNVHVCNLLTLLWEHKGGTSFAAGIFCTPVVLWVSPSKTSKAKKKGHAWTGWDRQAKASDINKQEDQSTSEAADAADMKPLIHQSKLSLQEWVQEAFKVA